MPERDKVDGLRALATRLAPEAATLALGDGENDRAMLESATFAVVMPRKDGTCLALKRAEGVTIAPAPGPLAGARRCWRCSVLFPPRPSPYAQASLAMSDFSKTAPLPPFTASGPEASMT